MNRKLLYFFGIGIIITVALASVLSVYFLPRIGWNRITDGVNPNPHPDAWYNSPLSELEDRYDRPDRGFMSLEEAQLQLDELNFEIKTPQRRSLPFRFSVVGVIHTPPAFQAPRGFVGAPVPEKVILLISDKPISLDMTKLEFDMSGGISFEILDYFRACPRFPDSERPNMRHLLDRYPITVSDNFVEACYIDEEVVYRVYGKYGEAELVSLMEHLLGM